MRLKSSVVDLLYSAADRAFYEVVPAPQDRTPLTWRTFPNASAYFLPYLFMAYLVRRDGTRLIRMLCLPAVVAMAVRCTVEYTSEGADAKLFHCARRLLALTIVAKALDFAFVGRGRLKIGEKSLPSLGSPVASAPTSSQPSGPENRGGYKNIRFPAWLIDALEVSSVVRGVGWDFGRDLYVPELRRPKNRGPFLRATALAIVQTFICIDSAGLILRAMPGLRDPEGGSIFLPQLPLFYRYTLSTTIHVLAGFVIMWGIDLLYDTTSFFAVAVLGHAPSSWPPAQDCPTRSCSLHEFWAKRWHQMLRNAFLTYGGYPGQWIAGDVGRVLGSFFASGIYHEVALQVADHRITLFFMLQAVGLLMEKAYRKLSGHRVGGITGWLWTALFVLVFGQMLTDAFAIGGMAGGVMLPEELSPASRVLSPILQRWGSQVEACDAVQTALT